MKLIWSRAQGTKWQCIESGGPDSAAGQSEETSNESKRSAILCIKFIEGCFSCQVRFYLVVRVSDRNFSTKYEDVLLK
jgi:hypothetical protein